MAATVSSIVFDDIFTINAIDKEGKKFDRGLRYFSCAKINLRLPNLVSRLYAHSKNYDMDLTLDYNVELFPLQSDQSIALALAASLSRTGPTAGEDGADTDRNVWRPDWKGKTGGLDDDYDYVMYGKVRLFLRL